MSNQTSAVQITLTMEQLRAIIREEIEQAKQQNTHQEEDQVGLYGDLSDFPIINSPWWDESISLRREDMYGDDGR